MTHLKIAGSPTASAMSALEPHIPRIYDRPGIHVMAIVELEHTERVQPAPNSDAEPIVRMRIVGCEVPNTDQEGVVREAQRALFLARTARGTLDEEGMLQLDEDTLKLTPGLLMSIECARLRAGLVHWTEYARRVVASSGKLIESEIIHELQTVADGLRAVLATAAPEEES